MYPAMIWMRTFWARHATNNYHLEVKRIFNWMREAIA